MTNLLGDDRKQQVRALGQLGWTVRRIEEATGVRREAANAYLNAAGIAVRDSRHRQLASSKPASEVSTGPPGTGKSHLAQAIGVAVIQQGHRVLHREAHVLLEELADAQIAGTRKAYLAVATSVPLLIVDDLGMRELPATAAEDLREIVMRRYEPAATLVTSNRPVEDWGKLLRDTAAVTALSDRVLHHAHVLTCGPRRWRTRLQSDRNAS